MTHPISVSVVIPALNEGSVIKSLLTEIDAALPGRSDYEIVVVDDGSTDDTAARLAASPAHWRLVQHADRAGQSAAIHSGVMMARGPLIVTLDGDGQNPPADIPLVLAPFEAPEMHASLGLVAGQRVNRQDAAAKRWASKAANTIRATILRDGTRDTGCGLKAFRKDAFLSLPYFNHMHRYLPALFKRAGYQVALVDVGHAPRAAGQSKYNNLQRAVVGAVDLMGVWWLIRRAKTAQPTELQKKKVPT